MAQPSAGNGLLVIERILRDRAGIWRQIIEERGLRDLIVHMLSSAGVSLALYGAVLGASYGWQQAFSSLVKLPLLFLATLCICLPTLYLFNLVFGARLSVVQAVALIMVSVTVTSVLTLAFAPISLFFLVTAQSYAFFKLLNVAILTLTAFVGLRFLVDGMRALNDQHADAVARPQVPVPHGATAAPALVGAGAVNPGVVNPGAVNAGAVNAGVGHGGAVHAGAANGGQPQAAPVAAPVAPPVAVPAGATPHPGMLTVPVQGRPGGPGVPDLPSHLAELMVPMPGNAVAPLLQPRPVPVANAPRQASMSLLYIWILLFGFVGTQLGWTLRPFFGSPGEPFSLFRHLDGTFYGDILHTIGQLLGG